MPPLSSPIPPPLLLTGLAVGVALLQLILARWRDLGPATVGLAGMALVLGLPQPALEVVGGLGLSLGIASAAWARGGRRGVGRPALVGLVIGGAAVAAVAVPLLDGRVPVPAERLRLAAASALGLLALLAWGFALMRARPAVPPPRWVGPVTVEEPS